MALSRALGVLAHAEAPRVRPACQRHGAAAAPANPPARRNPGLDPAAFLADNDSTGFFMGIRDLLNRGPTAAKIDDFRAIVVDRP